MSKIAVIGNANADLIAFVDDLPELDEVREAKDWTIMPGGSGSNFSIAARSLGANVTLMTAIGNGKFSELVKEVLLLRGINLYAIPKDGEQSIIFIASTPRGKVMYSLKGVSHQLRPEDLPGELDADILHVASKSSSFVERYLGKIPLSYSPGPSCFYEPRRVRKLVRELDFLFVNEPEARALGLLEEPRPLPKKALVITMGDKGSLVITKDFKLRVGVYPVERVVDPTGAGDTYAAAFVVTYLETRDLAESARRAAVAGALAVTVVGGSVVLNREVVIKEAKKVIVERE
ncbi:hypothetical protein IPA_04610 [Ignicoccus pacificus DSM 13166]|uniref:Carbohydrate kinase PfkB domain-containing protein n=1 Tax=Ignicoccus pacificus DSM 13166 TaxID=940294 RepID=A0A977KB68_9CREN|nr:hypothetical protein IPA_04610 [Ignicoccus pacificus DSM 13166]